jgi:hypothetical protein
MFFRKMSAENLRGTIKFSVCSMKRGRIFIRGCATIARRAHGCVFLKVVLNNAPMRI